MGIKLITVAVWILIVGVVFWYIYNRLLKPLRGVSADSALRVELARLVGIHLGELDKKEDYEYLSDVIFDLMVKEFTSDEGGKSWFYYQKGEGVGLMLESELKDLDVEYSEDPLMLAVLRVYLEMSAFARGHPDAEQWTAFGYLSWVNLNIDQILEGRKVESL